MKRKHIFMRTFRSLISGMLLLIIIIHVSIFFIYRNMYIRSCRQEAERDMKYITQVLRDTDDYDSVLKAFSENNHVNIGFKTASTVKFYSGDESVYLEFFSPQDAIVDVAGIDGTESVLFKTRDVLLKSGEEGMIQLSMSMQQLKESRQTALLLLPYSTLVSLIFSLLFSYFYSRRITRPLLTMSTEVKKMTELMEGVKINIHNQDELGALADDINLLYGSLLKVIDDYRVRTDEVMHLERERLDFFRGASHELKTPLARLSVLTENMKYNVGKYKDHDRYLSESLEIISELSKMISEILDGVKNIRNDEKNNEPIQVRPLLEKAVDDYSLIVKSKHQILKLDIDGDFELRITEADFSKVLSNIISNATKYGLEGGRIIISLDNSELCVYNEANQIPDEVMKSIWKGEYLLNQSTDQSSGLGLYIVKNILDGSNIKFSFVSYDDGYLFTIKNSSSG